ncbi:M23 family metallopeptidase [Allokutzneria sp. A3M-2-11 16]|uniref:M23 family metallopeptidase n=1 Tax=Allokutzneria sp. A3M-2-11 16 TaxID=2962043 RepID=UPI0020B82E10|nr:M23 family metallopeptidase [Allokutzneria sp. A3M-2-11 16]MCP3797744.1 M23 family metallopeptidase [Allokutzneria sp. A3M-2-11 16]
MELKHALFSLRAKVIGVLIGSVLLSSVLVVPAQAAAMPSMALPFSAGQRAYSAGVHSDNGQSGVRNALDFSPSDGLARAAAPGTVRIQRCARGNWVTVDHTDGWRTGYYHLEGIRVSDNQQVAAGAVLGRTGNALPCGGSSSGAHVHFTLWQLGAFDADDWSGLSYEDLSTRVAAANGVAVHGKVFGGWRVSQGASQYSGSLTRTRDGFTVRLPAWFQS